MEISDKEKIELYKKMIEIRNFEETVAELYRKGKVPGSVHLYIGEEAVASGVCAALNERDYVYSTHRGHGHCLAKGADPKKLLAELCGKETDYCNGKSGSMHVFVPEINFMGTNGIVSGGLTISTGAGMSIRLKGTNNVSVCFFGDGASNIGPTLIECKTYRICGHYEGDHMTGYRTQDEIEQWKQKDPIKKMRGHLLNNKIQCQWLFEWHAVQENQVVVIIASRSIRCL